MEFKSRTIKEIAEMICGNFEKEQSFFRYRSSSYLTEFFQDCGTHYRHDGSTRGGVGDRNSPADYGRAIPGAEHAS